MSTLFHPHTLTAVRALVRKDLWLWLTNRRSLTIGVLAPVFLAAFFGYLFDSNRQASTSRIPVAITDLDRSTISTQVLAGLAADAALELQPMAEAEATAAVTRGDVKAAIVLPAGFGAQAAAALFGPSAKPQLTVRYDPSQSMVLPMVRGLLAQQVMGPVFNSLTRSGPGGQADAVLQPLRDAAAAGSAGAPEALADLRGLLGSVERLQQRAARAEAGASAASGSASAAAGATGMRMPFSVAEIAATGRLGQQYNSYAHAFGGMSVQFILLTGIDVGVALLLARRMGLWTRLRAAPVSQGVLLGSRILSAALIAFVLMLTVFAIGAVAFGVRIQGSVAGFVGVAAAFALFSASFGLLVAALGKTPEGTRGLAILVMLILVMLGGAWAPSFIFPPWLQTVSLLTPTRWAMDGLDAVTWRAQGLVAVLPAIGGLLATTVAFSTLALWRFSREAAGQS